eukprot:s636_g2.t1
MKTRPKAWCFARKPPGLCRIKVDHKVLAANATLVSPSSPSGYDQVPQAVPISRDQVDGAGLPSKSQDGMILLRQRDGKAEGGDKERKSALKLKRTVTSTSQRRVSDTEVSDVPGKLVLRCVGLPGPQQQEREDLVLGT